ncbi:hypothetical protein BKA70DRAFT_1323768 [Coprinopsis sp. MPI-PUGE-AT-0042]|nr:hypothetical protein BKA70DRAFT_1323768 [Coprinopsis sp. MPI-PUGE-AT-0042]
MIVLYDVASLLPHAWSPNTLKTRLCLAYKGLQHKSEWVEFPDIAAVCKEKGFKSNSIAKYLDATYPKIKRVIPEGKEAEEFQRDFPLAFRKLVFLPLAHIFFPRVANIFNPTSKEHYAKDRANLMLNTDYLDHVQVKSGEEESAIGDDFRKGWDELERKYYAPTDDKGPWILGDTVVFGQESTEWQELRSLNGGRWGRLFDEIQYLLKVEY